MFSKRTLEGELLIDHRAGDGTIAVPAGRRFEAPTITCSHCQAIVIVNPDRQRPRAYCRECDRYICDKCEAVRASPGYVHQSFSEFADLYLNRASKGLL